MNRITGWRPIPDYSGLDLATVRQHPIDECGELLVPASLCPERILVRPQYFIEGLPGALPECYVREGVLERLVHAADTLPSGYKLVLLDSWRPFVLQKWLFEQHEQQFNVEGSLSCKQSPETFVSRPSENIEQQPPFHLTGGAVDVTLANSYGQTLDMGTRFDETTAASYTYHYEAVDEADKHGCSVRDNRRFLYQIMVDSGFVNIPSEWWHFSYGDQLWASLNGHNRAIYGHTHPRFAWGDPEQR